VNRKLLIILLIALIVRVVYLSEPAFYFDEGIHSELTRLYLNGEIATPWERFDQPPVSTYFNALSASVLGLSEFSMRIVEVIFGVLTVAIMYLLTKKLFNEKVALISSLLLAVTPLHVIYSRFAYTDVMLLFFMLVSVLFTEYSFDRKSYRYPLLAGLFAALAFLTKYSAIVVLLPYHLIFFLRTGERDFGKWVKNIAVQIITFIMVFIFILDGYSWISFGKSFAYLVLLQSFLVLNKPPIVYRIELFFNILSPVLFLLSITGFFYLVYRFYKKRDYSSGLVTWMLFFLTTVFLLEARIYPRHILPLIPFALMAAAVFISNIDKKWFSVLFTIILISVSLVMYVEVCRASDFITWKEVGNYVNEKGGRVFTDYTYPLFYYIKNDKVFIEGNASLDENKLLMNIRRPKLVGLNFQQIKKSENLKSGDLILLSSSKWDQAKVLMSPMQRGFMRDEIFWISGIKTKEEFIENRKHFSKEIEKKFNLTKVFYYNSEPVVWVYRV